MNGKYRRVIVLFIVSVTISMSFFMVYPQASSWLAAYMHGDARIHVDITKDWLDMAYTNAFGSTRFSLTFTILAFVSSVVSVVCVAYLAKNLLAEKNAKNKKAKKEL